MLDHSVFYIDCSPIIPECEFQCTKCFQEMLSAFDAVKGVAKFYTKGAGEDTQIVVEHDTSTVSAEELMDTFKRLPTFYKGFFVPKLLEA